VFEYSGKQFRCHSDIQCSAVCIGDNIDIALLFHGLVGSCRLSAGPSAGLRVT